VHELDGIYDPTTPDRTAFMPKGGKGDLGRMGRLRRRSLYMVPHYYAPWGAK